MESKNMADNSIVQTIQDAEIDARSLSEFVSKHSGFVVTRRLASPIYTLDYYLGRMTSATNEAINIAKSAIVNSGYTVVGSFESGVTVQSANNVVQGSNGALYRWGGGLPKTVPSGSTPESTGGFGKTAWVEVSSVELSRRIEKLESGDTQYYYTQMGKAFDSKDGLGDPFASWPHANIAYDERTNNFVIFYNTNAGHSISTCSVLMRTKSAESDAFSEPVVVASDRGNFSYKTQASGIAANGDYISLVARFPWGSNTQDSTYVYRSTNKGASFTRTELTYNGASLLAYNGDITGFLVTLSGRILTFAVEPTTYESRIFYSDDNGATWKQSAITGNPLDVTEPAWCDLGGGKLVCMARAAVRKGSSNQVIPAKFMTSTDDGATWTAPVDSKSIPNFTLSNGTMLPDYDTERVEFVFHSRKAESDNLSSVYRSWATFDDAFNDNFKPQVRIGKIAAYISYGTAQGDSGYVGAAKSKNGTINAFYYNGLRTNAQINYMVGLPNAVSGRAYMIDDVTGDRYSASDMSKAANSSYFLESTPLYCDGELNAFDINPVSSTSIGSVEINAGYIRLSTNKVSDGVLFARFYLDNPVVLDDIDYIGCEIKSMTDTVDDYAGFTASHDVAVAVYTSHGGVYTPRLASAFTTKPGYLVVDTRGITGMGYIGVQIGSRYKEVAVEAVITKIFYKDSQQSLGFAPISDSEYALWHKGAGIGLVDGFNERHVGGDGITEPSIKTNGNFIVMHSTSATGSTSEHFYTSKEPLPAGVATIEICVQNKDYANLTSSFFYAGVTTQVKAQALNDITSRYFTRNTKGWAILRIKTQVTDGTQRLVIAQKPSGGEPLTTYIKYIYAY